MAVFELYDAAGNLQVDLATRITKVIGQGPIEAGGATITNPAFAEGDIWCMILPVENPEATRMGSRPTIAIYNRGSAGGARIVIGAYSASATFLAVWGIY